MILLVTGKADVACLVARERIAARRTAEAVDECVAATVFFGSGISTEGRA